MLQKCRTFCCVHVCNRIFANVCPPTRGALHVSQGGPAQVCPLWQLTSTEWHRVALTGWWPLEDTEFSVSMNKMGILLMYVLLLVSYIFWLLIPITLANPVSWSLTLCQSFPITPHQTTVALPDMAQLPHHISPDGGILICHFSRCSHLVFLLLQ